MLLQRPLSPQQNRFIMKILFNAASVAEAVLIFVRIINLAGADRPLLRIPVTAKRQLRFSHSRSQYKLTDLFVQGSELRACNTQTHMGHNGGDLRCLALVSEGKESIRVMTTVS